MPVKRLQKLTAKDFPNPKYFLEDIYFNNLIGQEISIIFTDKINCINCNRLINKTFNQGYCFQCFQKLACCDLCILKPELCHYHNGTCREPKWGEENCMIVHSIYLANSGGLKIGITREHQKHTRWIDQGATQVIELGTVASRLQAGLVEVQLKTKFNDRSDWRKLVTGKDIQIDLIAEFKKIESELALVKNFQINQQLANFSINYPVNKYLSKAVCFNEKKEQQISGVLNGIRGQYLLIGDRAINIRKFSGYQVEIDC